MRSWALALPFIGLMGVSALAQTPAGLTEKRPVTTIDFYGLRALDADVLRRVLPVHEGDKVSFDEAAGLRTRAEAALAAQPSVRASRLEIVCCDAKGGLALFVGVQEKGAPGLAFRPPPAGAQRLPEDLVTADAALDRALSQAIAAGRALEDDSQGHALAVNDPEVRALQEQRTALAGRHLALLREALSGSADPAQRAMAARYLGYAPDKQAVVDDLVRAVDDPDPGVRNDAVRALMVFSRAKAPPRVPYAPFVGLLQSLEWTDLNKASSALDALSASRDPKLLALLREQSLPALATIARWRSRGHAFAAVMILGRIAGLPDSEILKRWQGDEAETVIAAALRPR